MKGNDNLETARKLLRELKASYEALPLPYRRAVRSMLLSKSSAGSNATHAWERAS
jgi:hypothetical protein